MAEIQMFQPGTAFMNSYNQAKAGSLAKIAFTEPQRRQSALADLYGLDPQAANSMKKEFDAQEQEQLKTFATAFVNAPDDNMRSQMYARAKEMWHPRFQALGSDIPDDWRQALPTIQALAGAGSKPKARSSHILADGTIAFMDEYGNLTKTGEKASNSFRPIVGANGEIIGYDPRENKASPTAVGGQNPPPAEVSQGDDPMASYLERIRMGGELLAQNGVPVEKINAWKEAEFAKAQQELSSKGVTFAPPAGTSTQPPQQARVSVKQPEGKVETWGTPTAVVKDGKTVMIQLSNLGNERVRSDLSPADSNKAPSGEASNAAGFYSRMEQSERLISQIEAGGYSPSKNKGDFFTAGGTFTNWATSPKGRQYYNAASNWIRANLRKESGAAIGVDEMKQEFATYFPVPGDDKDTIEQKRLLRQQTAEAVRQAGAPAMRYQERTQGQQGQQGQNFDPLGILK